MSDRDWDCAKERADTSSFVPREEEEAVAELWQTPEEVLPLSEEEAEACPPCSDEGLFLLEKTEPTDVSSHDNEEPEAATELDGRLPRAEEPSASLAESVFLPAEEKRLHATGEVSPSPAPTSPVSPRPFLPKQEKNYNPYQAGVAFQLWASPREIETRRVETGADLPEPRRFRASTFFIPLLMMLFHFAVMTASLVVFALGAILANGRDLPVHFGPDVWSQIYQHLMSAELQGKANLLMCMIIIPVYLIVIWRRKRKDRRSLLLEKPSFSSLGFSLLLTLGGLGATLLWMQFLQWLGNRYSYIAEQLKLYEEITEKLLGQDQELWLVILLSCVLIPIAEDLLFRGIIMGELRRAMPDAWAILLQAILFAAFHLNFVQSSYVIFPALALGLCYLMSRNLLVPIFMHGVYNFLGGVLPTLLKGNDEAQTILFIAESAFFAIAILTLVIRKVSGRKLYQVRD